MAGFEVTANSDIEMLISCEKEFRSKPRRPTTLNRNISQRFLVYGAQNNLEFDIFITYSQRLPQDFSLGLMHNNLLLCRYNGYHETTKSGFHSAMHHAYPHAHILTLQDIQSSRPRKPSQIVNFTGKYVDLQAATTVFCENCGIINHEDYLNINKQLQGQTYMNDYS